MALRWRRTIDVSPHMFSRPAAAEDDWLLYCGPWQVGRVSRPGGAHREMISWSLTGPHTPEAPGAKAGNTGDVDAAKAALIAAFRAWAAWAGIQPEGSEAPRWAPAAGGDADDWLLFSGGFMVGRVHRPASGPRRDPHWRLGVLSAATPVPFDQQGWAETVGEARARLLNAWCAWLAWAELPAPASPPAT
jgi:hypothetical protein